MNDRRHRHSALLIGAALPLLFGIAAADPGEERMPPPTGALVGRVIDAETKEPLGWATVTIVELKRNERTHQDGSFHFYNIPLGTFRLRVSYLGYQTAERLVGIPGLDTVELTIEMTPTPFQTESVVVLSDRERRYAPVKAEEVIAGKELQQQLGRTLAETLNDQPGLAERSMGPAPARPVIRGLSGDRLQIREDGEPTGDLSASSADHAVTLDPMTVDRIEIVQGPASLLFSSHALGGVINLIRDRIATNQPDRAHGTASLQGEGVNTAYGGGLSLSVPVGPLALQIDGSGRSAGDISTAIGELRNSDIGTYNGSLGVSYFLPWGYAGLAGGVYHSSYGVPGGFVGAHPNGVRVAVDRRFGEGAVNAFFEDSWLRRIELRGAYSRYRHEEQESDGVIGTEYGLISAEGTGLLHHGPMGPFDRGSIGITTDFRDFAANGVSVPPTIERGAAAFVYEEMGLGDLTLRGALRFDIESVRPSREEQSRIGHIRERSFSGLSGSLAALLPITDELHVEVMMMRSYRTPGIEELFSEGPHLAAYSYEVGNPDLDEEIGLGLEASLRYSSALGHVDLSLFRNRISGYIFPRNTGRLDFRTLLPIYQHSGAEVVMLGGELSLEWELIAGLVLNGSLSYVRGELIDSAAPLPMIPPLTSKAGLRYTSGPFTVGGSLRGAARQNRIGDFETPTPGYVVFDAFGQYQLVSGPLLHTIVLGIDNVANMEYRNHLSRTKSIMPEPGRNLRLLYRLYF